MDNSKLLSAKQISEHKTPTDCWIVVDGQVWDVTDFVPQHPGGAASRRRATRFSRASKF
jgi:L-lactate dehydrogenase (cytochrome)